MKNAKIKHILFLIIALCFSACKDFLDVEPLDNLAGNNFWQTKSDVEAFTNGIYGGLRNTVMNSSPFLIATGDFRCAPVSLNSTTNSDYQFITFLRSNSIGTLLTNGRYSETGDGTFGIWKITKWDEYYSLIQLANILHDQVADLPAGILTETEVRQYQAEAVFLRNLVYFFLVRIYGDVPYYTDANHSEALGRTNQVAVMQNCIADLMAVKDDLPWTYPDNSLVAVKAMRGSAIVLLMHMNLWAAGFDLNKAPYYEETEALGQEIMEQNGGAYALLPLDRTSDIFSGNSKEALFELVQDVNVGEQFNINSIFSNYVVKEPYLTNLIPILYYDLSFIRKIYPPAEPDRRAELWFDENLYNTTEQQTRKFLHPYQGSNGSGSLNSNIGNQMIFRYADAILMRAEALAEMGNDAEARTAVNLIRRRASANDFSSTGQNLKNDIFWERVRELMGEGQYYYDLVRTKKVVDGNFNSGVGMSLSAFDQGGWTWPIHQNALLNNPYMTLNQYWN